MDRPPPPDAAPPPDFGPLPTALPIPDGMAPPRRLLEPGDTLTGGGRSSCSHQQPASGNGDRWCAFWRKGATPPAADLWVINLTKVLAGKTPRCDGSSADCLRLTSTLWTASALAGPAHPYSHEFHGDTLIFYADAPVDPRLYSGPVYAWRPGWKAARKLTGDSGLLCFGQARTPAAYCLEEVLGDALSPESFTLRAGLLTEASGGPLPSLGPVRPVRTNGRPAWQAGFSPDGQLFALSSADPDPSIETLRVVPTSALGREAPHEVLRQVTQWTIGNDSKRLYFLREQADDEQSLHAADFPEGTAEVKLGDRVRDYLVPGEGEVVDRGVAFLTALSSQRTAYRVTADSRMPENSLSVFVFRDFLEDVHTAADQRFTGWLDAGFTARVVRHQDLSVCQLNTRPMTGAFEPLFLASSGLVFWSEDLDDDSGLRDAFYARPEDCQGKQRFARGIGYYLPLGDRGLIYTDERQPDERMTLKYAAVRKGADGWKLDQPVRVQGGVEYGYFTVLEEEHPLLIFKTVGPEAGTYLFGPLPF
jgi:hypothetical protein